MIDLRLHATKESGALLPARFSQAFAQWKKPRAAMRGQELRVSIDLALEDDACAAFMLDFPAQGARVHGTTSGRASIVLSWAFHALAKTLGCSLVDAATEKTVTPSPEGMIDEAMRYLAEYEAEVRASRARGGDADQGAELLSWLGREGLIALADDAELDEALPLDDVDATYEWLLDSDLVDDVFISERELGWVLRRFLARYRNLPEGSGTRRGFLRK